MKKIIVTFIAATIIIITGCNKPYDDIRDNGTGKLVVRITDDPFNINWIESATVTISKIEIRKEVVSDDDENADSTKCEDNDSTFVTLSEDPVTLDLLQLRNGVVEELVNLDIPKGDYDLIRLYVDKAELKLKDQPAPFSVKVPGGQQTGIKIFIKPHLSVHGGLTSELLLDVDLSKSFVMRGNLIHSAHINGFIFKPTIRAVNMTTAGRIEGVVSDTAKLKIKNAHVWVMQDTVIANAFTDTLGFYAFIGIPAGPYSVFATKDNYDTVHYDGIKVIPGNRIVQNFTLTGN